MELTQIDFTQYVLLLTVIAGVTELLNRLRAKDYWVAATIITSAVVGALFGAFNVEGLNLVSGLAVGFGAPGALTALGMIGKKSTPAPSTVVEP